MMNNELRPAEEAMLELGYDREDMKKPRVGVMNTWADYNPGHLHLKGVAQAVAENGFLGAFTGGITAAVVSAVIMALLFKPGDKR